MGELDGKVAVITGAGSGMGRASVEVFVRDRGHGFDLETVAEDRMGVTGSIINRMARHGGKATVRSQLGEGTEVRLEINR